MRLKVFRSSLEWLIVFEEIALTNDHSFMDLVFAYRSNIERPGCQQVVSLVSETQADPMWNDNHQFLLDRWKFELVINGRLSRFSPSSKDYSDVGIDTS